MALAEWIDLQEFASASGKLVACESGNNIPFAIQRTYYLYGLDPAERRGFHAHRSLQQVAICVHGHCRFLLDNGSEREEILLDRPTRGLLIRSLLWREMFDFSRDCVLVVLADQHFSEDDYIRDYEEFRRVSRV